MRATKYKAFPSDPSVVKSAARVLDILELFDLVRAELTAVEVARRLGYPQSSAAALLHSLAGLGYLDYSSETHGYLPTVRVMLLGSWLDGASTREGRLIRMLEAMMRDTGATVLLAARSGICAQYLHVVLGATSLSYYLEAGSRRLLVRSATGAALLRDVANDEIRRMVRRAAAEAEDPSSYSERDVLSNVQQIRDNGYVFVQNMVQPGFGAIAVRLPDTIDARRRPLAVAVAGPITELEHRVHDIVAAMHRLIGTHYGEALEVHD